MGKGNSVLNLLFHCTHIHHTCTPTHTCTGLPRKHLSSVGPSRCGGNLCSRMPSFL